jgi:hypothetical protein
MLNTLIVVESYMRSSSLPLGAINCHKCFSLTECLPTHPKTHKREVPRTYLKAHTRTRLSPSNVCASMTQPRALMLTGSDRSVLPFPRVAYHGFRDFTARHSYGNSLNTLLSCRSLEWIACLQIQRNCYAWYLRGCRTRRSKIMFVPKASKYDHI